MTKRNNTSDSEDNSKKPKSSAHKSLVWFRSDLRVADNKALSQASVFSGTPNGCIGLYIVCPSEWERHDWGAVKADFIQRNLLQLSSDLLKNFNIPLYVISVDEFSQVPHELVKFCKANDISTVWFNNEPEWDEIQRDLAVEKALEQNSILCCRFEDQCIVVPGLVLTKESKPYSVFTPFKNTWLAHIEANPITLESDPQVQASPSELSIEKIHSSIQSVFTALPEAFSLKADFKKRLANLWPAGAAEAQKRLDAFAKLRIRDYHESRNFPYLNDGTSALSPYLAMGVISARTCFLRAKQENHGKISSGSEGICTWISELCWRDFYRHILHHFPRVSRGKPFKIDSDKVEWKYPKTDAKAAEEFDRWCRGFTGYPIVDAAMRQLNSTGWMHNRLRMVVSMFLTKDLLIDWRSGEKYFMKHLIDGDFASNNGGWQWSASTGTDSQPYFRVFNPASQSAKFDPKGEFIRKWVPELKTLPTEHLHDPLKYSSAAKLRSLGYCEPMVDHAKARLKAIEVFKKVFSKA